MLDTTNVLPATQGNADKAPSDGQRPATRAQAWLLTIPRITPQQAAVLVSEAWRHFVLVQVVPARQVVARRLRPDGDDTFGAGLAVNDQDQLIATKTGAIAIDHFGRVRLCDIQRSAGLQEKPKTLVVDGSIVIDGPVGPDWVVHATGDVEIRGFVNDATIVAGGSVLVRGDVTGTGSSSVIVAGWNVMVNQAADAEILAGHHIAVAQQLLNCNVTAAGRVLVGSPPMKSGVITGGLVHAGQELALHRAGSRAVFPPELMVGPMPSIAGIDDAGGPRLAKQLTRLREQVTERLRRLEGERFSNDTTQLRQAYRSLWGLWIRERAMENLSDGEPILERIAVYGMLSLGSLITIHSKRFTVGHEITDPTQFILRDGQIAMQPAEPLERPVNLPPVRPVSQAAPAAAQAQRLSIKLPSSMVHELDLINMIDRQAAKDIYAVLARLEAEIHVCEARGSIKRLRVKDPETGVAQGFCYRRDDIAKLASSMGIRVVPPKR